MTWQTTPFLPALLLTALACLVLGVHIWRHRPAAGVGTAVASFAATGLWCVGYAMELSSANYEAQLLWANIQYIFISQLPTLMLAFALIYTGRGAMLSRGAVLALSVHPVATTLLAFASESLPWLRTGGEPFLQDGVVLVSWTYGPYFWIHTVYAYVLMASATVLLVPVILRSPHLYRLQALSVVLGIFAPWVANAVYILDLSPWPNLDLTPFSFFLYVLAMGWALLRLQFLDVVPIARDRVVEDLQDAVLVIGLTDRVADANPAAAALLGATVGDLVGRPASQLPAPVARAIADHGPTPSRREIELPVDAGTPRVLELRLTDAHDHRKRLRGRIVVFHDVTERKQAEEERVRSQRLLAAGELASGVAHNLNNILVGIMAPARRLEQGEVAELQRDAGIILSAAERARDLVQRLNRGGAGEDVVELEQVSVEAVVREAVQASRPRWEEREDKRRIDLTVSLHEVPTVRADRTGLHDALLNLIVNAVDAMPDGGDLTVSGRVTDEFVVLSVSDTGVGMDEATARRVFEPFFTTKVNIGTGLGLTTVHRSAQRWGGQIDIDSTPGKGTTFHLRIPVWEESPSRDGNHDTTRILIAEDEAIVAMVLADSVRKLGHHVDVVDNGKRALQQLRDSSYDVAILDLGLPGLPGNEVAEQARQKRPRLTTVLMTGWSLSDEDERRQPFDFVLSKPFDDRQARNALERALAMSELREGTN